MFLCQKWQTCPMKNRMGIQTAHIQTYLSPTACFRIAHGVAWPLYGSSTNGGTSPQKDGILFSVSIGKRAITALRCFLLREELLFKCYLRTWKTQHGLSVQMSFRSGCGQAPQGTTQEHSQSVGSDWMSCQCRLMFRQVTIWCQHG